MNFILKMFHFSLIKWLEERALALPESDITFIATKLNVSPDLVRSINKEITDAVIAEVSKGL
jgi:hypothetical protein